MSLSLTAPHWRSEGEIVPLDRFAVRQLDLEIVLDALLGVGDEPGGHVVVTGRRGMGKTTLVQRAVDAIRDDAGTNPHFYPLIFGEQAYGLTSAAELWLDALRALGEQPGQSRFRTVYETLRKESDDTRLHARALACLTRFADREGKRLVLAVENLDLILEEQFGDAERWTLRRTLLGERRIVLLGTATAKIAGLEHSRGPLYGLFRQHALKNLDLKGCQMLWHSVSGVGLRPRQVRPIQILTGGNPRLIERLSPFVSHTGLRGLPEHLLGLMESHTEAFAASMAAWPAPERKIFLALADLWVPATRAQLAEVARIDLPKMRALLGRLTHRGAIEGIAGPEGTQAFQVADRMVNLCHLLRHRVASAARARDTLHFMGLFYTRETLADLLGVTAQWAQRAPMPPVFLDDPDLAHRQTPFAARFFVQTAAVGRAKEGLLAIEASPNAHLLEPVAIALKMLLGRPIWAPLEIVEVAKDVVREIKALRAFWLLSERDGMNQPLA